MEEFMKKTAEARKAIVEFTNGKKGVSGRINPCPVCGKGALAFAVAAGNGHIHARCEAGCVAWME